MITINCRIHSINCGCLSISNRQQTAFIVSQSPLLVGIGKRHEPRIAINTCALVSGGSLPNSPTATLRATAGNLCLLIHEIVSMPKESCPINAKAACRDTKIDQVLLDVGAAKW